MSRWALDPVPESCGLLDDPPRVPPTAIGVATPPPPDRYPRRLGATRRIALAFLGIVLAMATLPLVSSPSTTRTAVAASLAAASVDVGLQAATATAHPWREVVAPAALRAFQSAATLPQTLTLRRVLLQSRRTRGSRDSQRLIE
jgi:hypothetical protein